MPTQTLSQLLTTHRSIRRYRPDPLDLELVLRICQEAVAGASSSGNLNSVSIVLTQDPQRKAKLYELHARQPMILQAPLVMTFCADSYRTRRWLARGAAADNFNNFMGYHVSALDAMIVAQNVCLGLESVGLGICYMGSTLTAMAEIAEFLELPDTCVPIASIVAGHPDEDPAKRDRLPLKALVHRERYICPSDSDIAQIYASREESAVARYQSDPALKACWAVHGITSMAQWYSSKFKYHPETLLADSAQLQRALVARNFLPPGWVAQPLEPPVS
ncbi:Oxygen-insensitive NADPH nitroreductase [Thiomonas sp. X19]|uniref:nitroreductase family protein n=1 Tax=Thiomonas sp. X19 TaxID=1050370 RepID=UPI000B69DC1F|nr:nitroreductase family protein [Thiomonas sp. X19]SCC93161.1 Oxygen-insensitive NADPH nitroreductase [Thiomonas sp. X19]